MYKQFHPFPIGTIFNPIKKCYDKKQNIKSVTINFPSRLNAMAIDPSKIATNFSMIFSPGEIVFSVNIPLVITIKKLASSDIKITKRTKRPTLVKHAALLMQSALNIADGLEIDVDNKSELKHSGLGSSSCLIAGVGTAINELYGKPIPKHLLLKYFAQNHGEEIEKSKDLLMPVQCIGGSAASGLYSGSLIILAGESVVITSRKITGHSVLIGIPKKYHPLDGKLLMKKEVKSFPKFIRTGQIYGADIAYTLVHTVLPSIKEGNLAPLGKLIFEYRFNMGSIENCSFLYPPMITIAKKLRPLFENGYAKILSLSSVGPAFFVVCENKHASTVKEAFLKLNLNTVETSLRNDTYNLVDIKYL